MANGKDRPRSVEVGTDFIPKLTGRENCVRNGRILEDEIAWQVRKAV